MYSTHQDVVLRPIGSVSENVSNWQIHGSFDPAGKDELFVQDIKQNGILVPLLVWASGVLHDGHRRLRAAKLAGISHIPVIVLEPADHEIAFKSAQLGRNLSTYAKCRMYREQIQDAYNASEENRMSNLSVSGEFGEIADPWAKLELFTSLGRRTLQGGLRTLNAISDLRATGQHEKAGKVESMFRERGLKPARTLLGEEEKDANDSETMDYGDWIGKAPRKPRSRKPVLACEKDVDRKGSIKLLARLESSMKDDGSFCPQAKAALDQLESLIQTSNEAVA